MSLHTVYFQLNIYGFYFSKLLKILEYITILPFLLGCENIAMYSISIIISRILPVYFWHGNKFLKNQFVNEHHHADSSESSPSMKLLCCSIKRKKSEEKMGCDYNQPTAIKPAPGMMVTRPTKVNGKGQAKNKIKILQWVPFHQIDEKPYDAVFRTDPLLYHKFHRNFSVEKLIFTL